MKDAEVLDLLEASLRIPSPSGEERVLAEFLAGFLPRWGFECAIDPVGNLIAAMGEGPDEGVLLGHIDTVPGDLPVYREHGILHGRGSVDAKASFVTFLAAIARAAPSLAGGRLVAIGCVEEEAASSRGAHAAKLRPPPRFCIVGEPSGWDAITLGYKGFLMMELRGEIGRAHGAHAAESATEIAAEAWQRIQGHARERNQGREKLFDRLMLRLVGGRGGADRDGIDRARFEFQWRLPPDIGSAELEAEIRPLLEDLDLRVRFQGAIEAWQGPRTTGLHRNLLAAIRAEGGAARCLLKTGTADLNIVAPHWGCPALAYGPGDASLDHAPDERIACDEVLRATRILTRALPGIMADCR
ncbi:MAG: M20/M25/M40 family metallo-hydrolase [Planctomycetes bacterium]|nr:M20/M25/M40 family metallo-hydrolase [Planctomycetota bacterium]